LWGSRRVRYTWRSFNIADSLLANLRRNAKEWLKSPEVMNEIRMLRREADEIIPLPQDIPSTPFAGEVADPMSDILEDYKNGIRENS
jgi:hypothetical protein